MRPSESQVRSPTRWLSRRNEWPIVYELKGPWHFIDIVHGGHRQQIGLRPQKLRLSVYGPQTFASVRRPTRVDSMSWHFRDLRWEMPPVVAAVGSTAVAAVAAAAPSSSSRGARKKSSRDCCRPVCWRAFCATKPTGELCVVQPASRAASLGEARRWLQPEARQSRRWAPVAGSGGPAGAASPVPVPALGLGQL